MGHDRPTRYAGVYVAKKCCQALRQLVILRSRRDPEALLRVHELVSEAKAALPEDEQTAVLLTAVLSYAQDLFSTTGLVKRAGLRMSESNYLKLQILAKLSLLYHRLSELEKEYLQAADTSIPDSSSGAARRRLRILVADDEPDTVQTIKILLEDEGHEVLGVYNGAELLREARKSRPDAVILDIGMPGLCGYDVARSLRAMYGANHPVLIAVTAYATSADKLIGRDAGFDHHFGKPVLIDNLLAALPVVDPRAASPR